ncbi:MAG: hypothetical protein LBU27_08600 [Candidatus Peribacteria bacterium]|nr:hypothetical protein [Candidatus Peribacteria bacterium]
MEVAKKGLVQQIDEIIYSLAKTQYAAHISKKALGGDPHLAMMKEMFKSGNFEYLQNISLIKENVGKVELLLRRPVATPEQRAAVATSQKKMKKLIFRIAAIGSFITIFTLGLYRPFR